MGSVDPSSPPPQAKPLESHRERALRHGRRARLYASAILVIGLLAVLVILISRNNRSAKLDWVFGSTHASVVWIILAAAVIGWLLGIATGAVFHHRTRTPR
jgi:uncharacterized integral membrane protein